MHLQNVRNKDCHRQTFLYKPRRFNFKSRCHRTAVRTRQTRHYRLSHLLSASLSRQSSCSRWRRRLSMQASLQGQLAFLPHCPQPLLLRLALRVSKQLFEAHSLSKAPPSVLLKSSFLCHLLALKSRLGQAPLTTISRYPLIPLIDQLPVCHLLAQVQYGLYASLVLR